MLSKIAPERWPSLFVHNAQPEQAPPELLAHLTSDKWVLY